MFETYVRSITVMFESLPSGTKKFKNELAMVTNRLNDSVDFLREVCQETGLNVPETKRQ